MMRGQQNIKYFFAVTAEEHNVIVNSEELIISVRTVHY
jgi:hypothetical protein